VISRRPSVVAGAVTLALLAAGALVALVGGDRKQGGAPRSNAAVGAAGARAMPGSHARFRYLAAQRSNVCGLQADAIMRQADGTALRGSCCSAMDEHAYREQVRALRAFPRIREIPRDPYDVPVSLTKRLLRLDATISLTRGQRSTYRRAMRMSDQKAPCCCPCWRWNAFRGLTKYLITRRRWPAARIADLIDALEGCGGPSEHRHS
jgi:hypothetical protein